MVLWTRPDRARGGYRTESQGDNPRITRVKDRTGNRLNSAFPIPEAMGHSFSPILCARDSPRGAPQARRCMYL